MKRVLAKDIPAGEIFLYQAPFQPIRAWIRIVSPDDYIRAESYYGYAHFGDWIPGERRLGAKSYPVKYLKLQPHEMVLI